MATVAIDLEADIQAVSDFRANTAAVIKQVQETGRPVVLTQRGRGAAVLVDVGVFQELVDEIELLRDLRAGFADMDAGRVVGNEEARASLLAELE